MSEPTVPDARSQPTMRVEEAGAFLGLGRSASYNAVHRGEIPSIVIGRRRLVPTARFREWLGLTNDAA